MSFADDLRIIWNLQASGARDYAARLQPNTADIAADPEAHKAEIAARICERWERDGQPEPLREYAWRRWPSLLMRLQRSRHTCYQVAASLRGLGRTQGRQLGGKGKR